MCKSNNISKIKATKAKRLDDSGEFLQMTVDSSGNILCGVKKDGSFYINSGISNNINNVKLKSLVMGQYYAPVILKENWKKEEQPVRASVKCYDFDNGAKLMEHSYVGNNFVKAAMLAITKFDTENKGVPFVWCGDYADNVSTDVYPIKKVTYTDEDGNPVEKEEGGIQIHDAAYKWFYADPEGDRDEKSEEYSRLLLMIQKSELYNFRYIINRTKGQYVKVPAYNKDRWFIHPLPILTCAGCGLGGGDYSGQICTNPEEKDWSKKEYEDSPNKKFIGVWAYDRISITNDLKDCKGLEEIEWFPEEE